MEEVQRSIAQTAAMDDELSVHIQALPQELRDIILFYTVPLESGDQIEINSNYVAPWQLQLNRNSRRELAPVYFGTNTFCARKSSTTFHEDMPIAKWLRAQSVAHRDMITRIECYLHDVFIGSRQRRAAILQSFKAILPVARNAAVGILRGGPTFEVEYVEEVVVTELRDLLSSYPPELRWDV